MYDTNSFIKQNLLFVFISFMMMIFSCLGVKGYEKGDEIFKEDYLTFTAGDEGATISFKPLSGTAYYSTDDGNTWNIVDNVNGSTITLDKVGDKVKFKGNNVTTGVSTTTGTPIWYKFSITKKVSASGCVDSLRLDDDGKFQGLTDACYRYMFRECTGLTAAPDLPTKNLAKSCYACMFEDCTNLINAPELPAQNLADSCYYSMFSSCSELTKSPMLSATNLAKDCYANMFYNCKKLNYVADFPNNMKPAEHCCDNMFHGCTSLKIVPNLPDKNLASYCYSNMFDECTGLETYYALSKKNIADGSYSDMFSKCTSLKSCIFKEFPESWNDYYIPGVDNITEIILKYENSTDDVERVRNSSWIENILKKNGSCLFINPDLKNIAIYFPEDFVIKSGFVSYLSKEEKAKVESIEFVNSPKDIRDNALSEFTNLKSISIKINVSKDSIVDSNFASYLSQKEKAKVKFIEFENSPKEIKDDAFSEFTNLKSIIFKDKISNMTFGNNPFPSMIGSRDVMEMVMKKHLKYN